MLKVSSRATLALSLSLAIPLYLFTNCSKVGFGESVASVSEGLSQALVLINNDARYTKVVEVDVQTSILKADEMYITNIPGCGAGGNWEPLAAQRSWALGDENKETPVYAKFRSLNRIELESECVHDTIVHDNIAPVISLLQAVPLYIKNSELDVRFLASDSGSGVASVQCGDGGAMQPCVQTYTRSGMAEGAQHAVLVATDHAGNSSAPFMVNWMVDKTPPVVSFNQTPSALTASTAAQFVFSAVDALSGVAGFECSLNGAAFAACASPFSANVPEGAQSFRVRSADQAGNLSQPLLYNWTVDLTAPTVQILSGPNPYSNSESAQFTFTGNDGQAPVSRFECKVDGGAYANCSSPFSTTNLSEGPHTFYLRGYDQIGNVSSPASYSWTVDRTGPVIAITLTPPSLAKESTANFAFTVHDSGSGVAAVECSLDGAAFTACGMAISYNNLSEGAHSFQVRARDLAENSSLSTIFRWTIDLTPPTVQILSGPVPFTPLTQATLSFTASDTQGAIAAIECRLDSGEFAPCSSPRTFTDLKEGAHTFYVRAHDEAGNVSPVKSYHWLVDHTPPHIVFNQAPLEVLARNQEALLDYEVSDLLSGVHLVVCGLSDPLQTCAAENTLTYPGTPGDYSFMIKATDRAGNTSESTITWNVSTGLHPRTQVVNLQASLKVDMLVVVDNSGSMAEEKRKMGERFGDFLSALQTLDWQVGIATADVDAGAPQKDGRLLALKGYSNTHIITPSMGVANAQTAFANTINAISTSEGSGGEQCIGASYRAIERSQTDTAENAPNRLLFRPDAALAVLIISDANENGSQIKNRPGELVKLVHNTWGEWKPFAFHSIIVKPLDSVCRNVKGNDDYGYTYAQISQLTGGLIGSVCEGDYGAQLSDMGVSVRSLARSISLNCEPQDTTGDGKADVMVTAPGGTHPPFSLNGLTLTFESEPAEGDYTFEYSCY